jgi:hypothetical protein
MMGGSYGAMGSGMMGGAGGYGPRMIGGLGRMMGGGMMGPGMMGGMMAMHGGGFGMMQGMVAAFDTNGDGLVSPEELRTGLDADLKKFDKNGDGKLSLAEYQGLWLQLMQRAMVRHFQMLDVDGNGEVTRQELDAPARVMERMQTLWKSHGGYGGQMPGRGGAGMMNGDN